MDEAIELALGFKFVCADRECKPCTLRLMAAIKRFSDTGNPEYPAKEKGLPDAVDLYCEDCRKAFNEQFNENLREMTALLKGHKAK